MENLADLALWPAALNMPVSLIFEKKLQAQGFQFIAGVDEVGRGCLAGPVVAAAVILPEKTKIPKLDDSKKLSPSLREKICAEIIKKALAIGIAEVSPEIIDQKNIHRASLLAMLEAVKKLDPQPDYLLIDGRFKIKSALPQIAIIKGDGKSASIAAASVVAKVYRDNLMKKWDAKFPLYNFSKHKGYATKLHCQALEDFGPCEIHRKSFSPVAKFFPPLLVDKKTFC